MGARQFLNENPKLVAVVVAAVIVLAALWMFLAGGSDSSVTTTPAEQAFFSIDDGKSWFPGDISKIPPFQKDSKEALRAYVFQCPDGKQFVSCLVRYSPQVQKELEAIYAGEGDKRDFLVIKQLELDGLQVKPPGRDIWLSGSDPRAAELMTPRCADGSYAQALEP